MDKKFNMEKDFLIFDLDGTLINSQKDISDAVNFTLKRLGMSKIEDSVIADYIGDGVLPLIEKCIKNSEKTISLQKAEKILLRYYEKNLLKHTKLYDGIREILSKLSRNFNLVVLTNKHYYLAEKILRGLDAIHFFSGVYGGDSFDVKKPDPKLLQRMKIPQKRKTTIIGDGINDIIFGNRAGIITCLAMWGFKSQKVLQEAKKQNLRIDFIFYQPGDILSLSAKETKL